MAQPSSLRKRSKRDGMKTDPLLEADRKHVSCKYIQNTNTFEYIVKSALADTFWKL